VVCSEITKSNFYRKNRRRWYSNDISAYRIFQTECKFQSSFSKNNKVLGIFKGPDKEETSKINRPQTPKPPYSYNTEEVTITNPIDKNLLAGTLTTPQNYNKNIPVYVLITGSGQQTGIVNFTIINLLLSLPII
jgi:hypothetical protein